MMSASPRSRGWTLQQAGAQDHQRGFPALAGMDLDDHDRRADLVGLPRARGDGPEPKSPVAASWMASPRSRGWTPGADPLGAVGPGFPALAGMDPLQ